MSSSFGKSAIHFLLLQFSESLEKHSSSPKFSSSFVIFAPVYKVRNKISAARHWIKVRFLNDNYLYAWAVTYEIF
ncbi:MAG: hypothetical protein EA360_11605 [Balneolaceae bacterium]|nr:MAG: hypothetical protein EA360_11605 [Balneolaceae bacterium]